MGHLRHSLCVSNSIALAGHRYDLACAKRRYSCKRSYVVYAATAIFSWCSATRHSNRSCARTDNSLRQLSGRVQRRRNDYCKYRTACPTREVTTMLDFSNALSIGEVGSYGQIGGENHRTAAVNSSEKETKQTQ